MISIFVNDLDYDKSFGHMEHVELVGRFENNTIPGGQTVVLNNEEIKGSSVEGERCSPRSVRGCDSWWRPFRSIMM
jgi:hypothetical protein